MTSKERARTPNQQNTSERVVELHDISVPELDDLDDLDLHYAKPKRRARKRGTVQVARTRDPRRANVFKR